MLRPLIRPIVRPLVRGVTEPGYGGLRLLSVDSYRADTAPAALSISTYDGSGVLLHPSVWDAHIDTGGDWNGFRYWLAATPLPASNNAFENPCIYASHNLETWVEPVGLSNPIEPQPAGGYNSDTHLVWGRDGYLYCVWRAAEAVEPSERIYFLRSADGVTWGDKTLMRQSDSSVAMIASPAVLWDGVQWVMYGVDTLPSPNKLVRLTSSAMGGVWSGATECSVSMPAGRDVWHIDVKLVGGRWVLLLQETAVDVSYGGSVYLCYSSDGLSFSRPDEPVLPRAGNWHEVLYRSCLVPKTVAGVWSFDLIYTGRTIAAGGRLGRSEILSFDLTDYAMEPARAIAAAVDEEAPYILGDDFDRADGAIGTSTAGDVWTASAGSFLVSSGRAVASAAGNNRAYLEVGVPDFQVECEITHAVGTESWLVFRLATGSSYWRVGFANQMMRLQKVSGSVTTILAGELAPAYYGLPASGRLAVRAYESQITVLWNGRIVFTVDDLFNATETKVGIQTSTTSTQFDNFWAKAL